MQECINAVSRSATLWVKYESFSPIPSFSSFISQTHAIQSNSFKIAQKFIYFPHLPTEIRLQICVKVFRLKSSKYALLSRVPSLETPGVNHWEMKTKNRTQR